MNPHKNTHREYLNLVDGLNVDKFIIEREIWLKGGIM